MDNQTLQQNNDQEVLKLVERFGFKFFGYDENSLTLVVAPNGQIVPLKVAYDFVQTQIANSQVTGGGPESMPNMPTMPVIPDANLETSIEKESTIEKSVEKKQEVANVAAQPIPVVQQPTTPAKPKEPESPYGDGFKTPINPVYIEKAIEYIKKNSRKSLSSTSKWLSVQFEKFVSEQKSSKS